MDKKKSSDQLQEMMEGWFKKLPALPPSAVTTIVSITPWLALIFGIIGVLGAIAAFGILSFLSPFAMLGGAAPRYGLGMISTVIWLVSSVLMLMAFPGLKSQKTGGWNLLFWSEVVGAIASIISISIGSIIGVVIAFYLLFQIKSKYI